MRSISLASAWTGSAEEAGAIDRALGPLLDEGALFLLLDLLRLLRLLRAQGVSVVAPWEILVQFPSHIGHSLGMHPARQA